MNRLWNWLKTAIENRPITFVIVGGVIIYPLAILITILLIASVRHTSIFVLPFLSAFIVVGFHWFVARYERKSRIAQIIAIVPAGFFAVLCIVSGLGIMESHMCWKDPATGSIECRIP